MSIINDALKKADYFKKWRLAKELDARAELEIPAINTEQIQQKTPAPIKREILFPIQNEAPPFKVSFPSGKISADNYRPQFAKLVTVGVLGVGFVLLLLGPWIYMSTFHKLNAMQNQTAETRSPATTTQTPRETIVVEPKLVDQKRTFKPYQKPVRPSVRPIPRTVHERAPELVFNLTGISVLNEKDRLAFINGKVVQAGDTIGDAKVQSVEDKKVTLFRAGKEFVLELE